MPCAPRVRSPEIWREVRSQQIWREKLDEESQGRGQKGKGGGGRHAWNLQRFSHTPRLAAWLAALSFLGIISRISRSQRNLLNRWMRFRRRTY